MKVYSIVTSNRHESILAFHQTIMSGNVNLNYFVNDQHENLFLSQKSCWEFIKKSGIIETIIIEDEMSEEQFETLINTRKQTPVISKIRPIYVLELERDREIK